MHKVSKFSFSFNDTVRVDVVDVDIYIDWNARRLSNSAPLKSGRRYRLEDRIYP
jgi:hypothetical protein